MDFLKRVRKIHRSRSYLSVRQFCFLTFGMLSFQYVKSCWRSHILILHTCQEATNILVILVLQVIRVQEYIFNRQTSFELYWIYECKVSDTLVKDITATSVCSETMMTLFRGILSQRNFMRGKQFCKICQVNDLRGC